MTAHTCDVAVVIPTYNHAHFLRAAIDSACSQMPKPREIIVVDDGSGDHPEEVTKDFENVRIVRQANAGLAAARNRGLRESTSAHVVFLDADDRLLPGALAAGLESLGEDDMAAFTYGKYAIVTAPTAERTYAVNTPVPKQAFAHFLRENCIGMHGTVMYRRGAIEHAGGFREHLRACEDYDLYLRLARDWPVLCHDAYCAEYWHHDANMSRDPAFMLKAALEVLGDYRHDAESRGLSADHRAGIEGWRRYYVQTWFERARQSTLRALATAPAMMTMAPRRMIRTAGRLLLARLR
jgi:glycosyltransferase involved in cell wall biosynthesis